VLAPDGTRRGTTGNRPCSTRLMPHWLRQLPLTLLQVQLLQQQQEEEWQLKRQPTEPLQRAQLRCLRN